MSTLIWSLLWLGGLIALAYHRASLITATTVVGIGLVFTTLMSPFSWFTILLLWLVCGGIAVVLNHPEYKRKFIIVPAFDALAKTLPTMSETEKAALEAGTVGWDGELFSGQPQWEKLLTIPTPRLSDEEQAYIDGPVKELCEMANEWEITEELLDLPEDIWNYLKTNGFFALMIPKKYGGKGFSEFAHSEVLTLLATRSGTLASTVAVPNSLGPAELLLRYGTLAQQDHFLPKLASGDEIPCFALTGPEAGSDAGAISDTGIICKGTFNGKEITGIRLNWNKRYITLSPLATLLGLAFKLYDPEHLLGEKKDLGITCALIPVSTQGVTTGRRHWPTHIPFQNGPTQGHDVFIPLDWIIGGPAMAGQGWRMLVECLSTGRAISLPSISSGSARMCALTTGAYSRIRRQFHTSITSFEGIQEAMGKIGGFTYIADAIRYLTVSMIDAGERPSVPGAIAKYHVTELGRRVVNYAMDVHGGKGVMSGPKNYLLPAYNGIPIAITVEGANILTRNMIIFGQGAIRCHPYLLKEMQALQHDKLSDFEHHFEQHLSFTLSNAARALFHGLTFSRFAYSPMTNASKVYFQQLARASSSFALVSDACMAMLGGKLKFKESISARLGDLLSMMYIMSAVLKRYQDQGAPESDLPLLKWSLDYCLAKYWRVMDELLHNLPHRGVALGLRVLVMPFGVPRRAPSDTYNRAITELLSTQNDTRTRLLNSVFVSNRPTDPVRVLEMAFEMSSQHQELLKRVYDAVKHQTVPPGNFRESIEGALAIKILNTEEAEILFQIDTLCQTAISVDDFDPEDMMNREGLQDLPAHSQRTHG